MSDARVAQAAEAATTERGPVAGMRILLLGYTRFALRQKTMFESRGANATYVKRHFGLRALPFMPLYDVVYQMGGPLVPRSIFEACKLFHKPIVKHWLGSDTLRLHDADVRRQCASSIVTNWADAPWLVDELKAEGISGEVMGLSPIAATAELPMPAAPLTVLWFLPEDRFEFYGGQMALSLARAMPDARFLFVGCERRGRPAPANVEYLGFLDDIDLAYARAHVLVRMPDHDGLSQMVLEALNHGRYVVWNYPFEASMTASMEDEVAAHLNGLKQRLATGALPHNDAGRDYVRREYLGDVVADRICAGIAHVARTRNNGVHHRG